jgi:hypothetical protein
MRAHATFLALGALLACSSSPHFTPPQPCAADTDCAAHERCLFALDAGCDAQSVCVATSATSSCAPAPFIACDGTETCVDCSTPIGFWIAPVADGPEFGPSCACEPDAGAKPPGTPCASAADCGLLQVCVYAVSEGCSATPTCQDEYCGDCPVFVDPYCNCQGTTIYESCGKIPDGFLDVPVASQGACDAGALDASTE